MRVLITGGYGFVGRHLARHHVECGDDVAVTYHPTFEQDAKEIIHEAGRPGEISIPKSIQSFALDVLDKNSINDLIALCQPDAICHLAAISSVPGTENSSSDVLNVNFQGTLSLFDAVAEHSKNTKILFVSSSEVYGDPKPGTLPLTESAEMRPITAYGMSKAAADVAAFKYASRDDIHIVRVRPFPHTGPGQQDIFAISSFAKQIASIKLGQAEPIVKVGNLEAKRDYSDVSDIVRGYREALLNGNSGSAYNLCSGQSYEIQELLNMLIEISEVEVEVQVDPARVRPIDIADSHGSYAKAQKEFGWKPRVELKATLSSLITHWMEKLAK